MALDEYDETMTKKKKTNKNKRKLDGLGSK